MLPLLHFLLPPGEENRGKGLQQDEGHGQRRKYVFINSLQIKNRAFALNARFF
jgi:hypothetical protein